MTSNEYKNSNSPKLQRCFKCLDWIAIKPTEPQMERCPYCGTEQSSLTYDNNLDKKLLSDGDLQKRDLLLRLLRIWQFKSKNKYLNSYEQMPPYFIPVELLKMKDDDA